jgi:class 3 adenylate cyclase
MREMIAAHRGYVVSTEGDAFFAAFKRTREAVDAATSAQRALAAHAWPQAVELRVRMAIHTGEVHLYADEYMGVDIHRCARICAAECGARCWSRTRPRRCLASPTTSSYATSAGTA